MKRSTIKRGRGNALATYTMLSKGTTDDANPNPTDKDYQSRQQTSEIKAIAVF
ncbi:hypothetical protein GCM10011391_25290 [Pullulanibacillus camelliae]|uniref:Uncharacterized protein n=1 Tax=Pullulanibacillus camelliae TaxID=1707096 RepID=A0A8J2YIU3_9BACL|nr:hypothetical protein GCM10011391_25290 [Pullulanibacillus camelliae]